MSQAIRFLPMLLLLLALGGAAGACGQAARAGRGQGHQGQGFSETPAAQTVAVRVAPGGRLAWERPAYEAAAGAVTFVVSSPAGMAHNFGVEDQGVAAHSRPFKGGTTNRYTLAGLAPGTYRIVCTVPGHREGGMVATLTVR